MRNKYKLIQTKVLTNLTKLLVTAYTTQPSSLNVIVRMLVTKNCVRLVQLSQLVLDIYRICTIIL